MNTFHKKILIALSAILFFGATVFLAARIPSIATADTTQNVSGFGWSSNIGWISFNNTSSGDATNYGVNVDVSGNFSGYAWSPSVGWISFSPGDLTPGVSGCTVAPCAPTFNWTTKAVTGWARAMTATSGGWDGWISLAGVKLDGTDTYAWGADVVGWLDFKGVTVGVAAPPAPAPVSASVGAMATCPANTPVTVSWSAVSVATSYLIQRDGTSLATVGSGLTSYIDTTAPQGTYIYSVAAANSSGTSVYTAASSVTVPACIAQVATPAISPVSGSYAGAVTVTITTATAGATIRYTTDGTPVNMSTSPIYGGSFTVTPNVTVNAKAYKSGMSDSATATATYTTTSVAQCSDKIDNDNDGKCDFNPVTDPLSACYNKPVDPGCSSPTDNSEFNISNIKPT